MKIRTMFGLAAIGSLLYLHRRRGGEWTLESFKDSGRELWRGVQAGAEKAKDEARRGLSDARDRLERTAKDVSSEVSTNISSSNGRMPR